MSNQRVILCGGLTIPDGETTGASIDLRLAGKDSNIALKISDISRKMVSNIPPVLVDLLEIAAYVYCADQATPRGGSGAKDIGAKWRRQFHFHVPVREPDLWSSETVLAALRNGLGFLSDDEYEFRFEKMTAPPPVTEYLDFGGDGGAGFQADEVLLFSGGLDSLGGAVQEAVVGKKKVALVSHRSAPKIASRQKELLADLVKYCPSRPFHVPVWVHKQNSRARDFTQRSRSFLFAALAVVVARIFGLWRIRFYENGVVSVNLPIASQVVGGRATRTTHPQVLNGFSDIFTALFEKPFVVENPFLWLTKAEVVRSIRDAGCGDVIRYTTSCTRVRESETLKTHCGECSQCLSRRFATLAAGCSDQEDPEEMYSLDLLTGARSPGTSRTMIESYVRTAKRIKDMSDMAFFSEFGESHRVTQHIRGLSVDTAASQLLDLHKRHATEVWDVIIKGFKDCAEEITDGTVPKDCLLILALPEEYKRSPVLGETTVEPLLILDEIRDGESNRALLARIVGRFRFDGVNKKIGSRELFFTYLLFKSTRGHIVDGEQITVVPAGDVVREFLQWSKDGYLRFSGEDRNRPHDRIQKMWREFVIQIEKEENLKKIFTNKHKDIDGQKLYGLLLRPTEKQILISSVSSLFQNQSA